jgi:alpha-tubulin suppressor-like RCC1 family protein
LADVVGIAAGGEHSLALRVDGSVWAFGRNNVGQLGDGTTANRNLAAPVPSLSGVVAISAGLTTSAALTGDGGNSGEMWAWGGNTQGQLGDGTTTNRLQPLRLGTAVAAVACGGTDTLRLLSDGTVTGTGVNDNGQIGDGAIGRRLTPSAMIGMLDAAQASVGSGHSLVRAAGGRVYATGWNAYGQVGDGTLERRLSPVPIFSPDRVVSIGAGSNHSIALDSLGRVFTWGQNSWGQLGLGHTTNQADPTLVTAIPAADQTWLEGDPDGDNLKTAEEIPLGGDPLDPDTNDDGLLDGAAARAGLSLTSLDMDGDGVANSVELAAGTDPFRADTDGDLVADGTDCYPLDSLRAECAAPQPGDVIPPVITLTLPPNAVLLTTTP